MSDTIYRQMAIDAMACISDSICGQQAIDALCDLPAAQERKKGEWISKGCYIYECSCCKGFVAETEPSAFYPEYDYCPWCGAYMNA